MIIPWQDDHVCAAAAAAAAVGSMVSSMCWNETCNMLATMQDGKFVVWCYPAVIHSDKDLLPLTKVVKEGRSELFTAWIDNTISNSASSLCIGMYKVLYTCIWTYV